MTQTTDLHPDQAPTSPFGPAAVPAAPDAPPTAPGHDGPGGPPAPVARRGDDRHGRPGWLGVGAVATGAAVLSSLLTAGVVTWADGSGDGGAGTPATTSALSSSASSATGTSGTTTTWAGVAAAVEPSVVTVAVQDGEGSGVVLDTSGHILTNYHVVSGAGSGGISVTLSNGRTYPATVVGTDPTTDLAVLKLSTVPSGLKPATLGNSSSLQVGDAVMAVGNPLGLSDTVTTGIISALDRPVSTSGGQGGQGGQGGLGGLGGLGGATTSGTQVVTNAIQTDAAVNPGNSGGALVDAQGRVIGITSSIASLSSGSGQSGSIGLGFAIPIDQAKTIAQELISSGHATHAYLGVSLRNGTVTVDGAQRAAAVVGQVSSGTAAQRAGLRAGDAIVAIDGRTISGADNLVGTIRALRPDATVQLTVIRSGSSQTLSATLGTAPSAG